VFIDDATGWLMHLQFVESESESTFAYFHATRAYLEVLQRGTALAAPRSTGPKHVVVFDRDGGVCFRRRFKNLAPSNMPPTAMAAGIAAPIRGTGDAATGNRWQSSKETEWDRLWQSERALGSR
jgi:hypothetical protein